ncbi:MAG TPA: Rieske (2Fe-2S) protein [Verrucomicrobiae bacterium]|nr:Rieske (2Fe-2S) protein [Verrucomicrobiae bacterium]
MSRREFLILAVGVTGVAATGCQSTGGNKERVINAGAASDYAADGVYARYRDYGFFIVRKDGKLFALSSYCTHRKCKLNAEADKTFYCACHGSTFDPTGKVTKGPARVDLPSPVITTNEQGQLLVTVTGV